jgi:hypothetical protein
LTTCPASSKIFTDRATAKHYQIQFGGEITEIKQYEEIKKYIQSPLDYKKNQVKVLILKLILPARNYTF